MSVVTRNGDGGVTRSLNGKIVRKDHPIIEFFGTIDELNSFLGLAKIHIGNKEKEIVKRVQKTLFKVAARVGDPERYPDVSDDTSWLEEVITSLEERVGTDDFVVPGASEAAALLDVCRTVTRRAERRLTTILRGDPRLLNAQIFLNRLSDMLFLLARSVERSSQE